MPFTKDQKVRIKADNTFAIVRDVEELKIKLNVKEFKLDKHGFPSSNIPPYYRNPNEIEPDGIIPNGTWCVCPFRNNRTFLIIDFREAVKPDKFESDYEYHFKMDFGNGISDWINGAYLNNFRTIARPANLNDFYDLLHRKVPLIYMPMVMRDKDFFLAFRGDDRYPGTIFGSGFFQQMEKVAPIFRTLKKEGERIYPQFDIETTSGVCASKSATAAGLFPIDDNKDETWVYAFFAYQPFSTLTVQEQAKTKFPEFSTNIEGMLKGEEIVMGSDGVPGETILVAFQVKRTWKKPGDWTKGCSYNVLGYMRNDKSFYVDDANYKDYLQKLEQQMWNCLHMKNSPALT